MKRYIIPLSMAVMVLASCSIEESQSPVSDGSHLVLTGSSNTSTRVSIGEKDGEGYPLLWFTGDAISINSKDATVTGAFVGELATLDSGSSGNVSGNFRSVNELVPETDMELLILYPGNGMDYKTRTITGTVAQSQTQRSANSSSHLGSSCFAFAETSIKAGQTDGVSFSLSHKTAFVKVVVNATEDYKSYKLSGVTLAADGERLSGTISYSVDDEETTNPEYTSVVGATISSPSDLSEEQSVYFTALPCDLTGKDVTLTVSLISESGETVSVPSTIEGGLLKESYLTVIKATPGEVEPWYEPTEVRDLMGGWAYGAQNTYLIEQKESDDTSITFEVKARGDYAKVKEPKYYGLVCPGEKAQLIYVKDGDKTISSAVSGSNNLAQVSEDCEITVYCKKDANANWGVVGIYDKDYNILWSFMIWKYLTGDVPGYVDYGSYQVMDRVIGCPYSNSLAEQNGTFDQPAAAYFQWGRKDPFPWSNSSPANMYTYKSKDVDTDVATSILNPTTAYCDATKAGDWKSSDNEAELWGGVSDGSELGQAGHKTVYDPCPEGYRVPDAYIINEVRTNGEEWQVDFSLNNNTANLKGQDEGLINEESPFYESHHAVVAYKLSNGKYDYWPFDGVFYGGDSYWDDRCSESAMTSYFYWTCNQSPDNYGKDVVVLALDSYTSGPSRDKHLPKIRRGPVRCQKE